nr:hypothetical protein SHINE37_70105 [Rhizobiaceae bacterium]
MVRPSRSRPSARKNSTAPSRSSTTIPTLSILFSAITTSPGVISAYMVVPAQPTTREARAAGVEVNRSLLAPFRRSPSRLRRLVFGDDPIARRGESQAGRGKVCW